MKAFTSVLRKGTYGTAEELGNVSFDDVLHGEIDLIGKSRELRQDPGVAVRQDSSDDSTPSARDRALRSNLVGLSFSGGGIRSATFNLGVLQALAELGLLKRFDYLSTVSGGGYIGSWLTALIFRTYEKLKGSGQGAEEAGKKAIEEVERRIRSDREDEVEDGAVYFLRRFSNYLTPKVGLFSADTWAVVTTYLRNLLLNLVILISAFSLALLLPRILRYVAQRLEGRQLSEWSLLLPAVLLGVLAFGAIGVNIGSFAAGLRAKLYPGYRWLTQAGIQRQIVLPLLVVAGLLAAWLQYRQESPVWWSWPAWGAVAYLMFWVTAWLGSRIRYRQWTGGVGWRALMATAIVAGALGGLGLGVLDHAVSRVGPWEAILWAPPAILLFFFLLAAIQTGFIGRAIRDHQREWLSRLGAWLLIYGLGWFVLVLISTCGAVFYLWAGSYLRTSMILGWIGATGAGLVAGRSSDTSSGGASKWKAMVAKVAPYVFVFGLLIGLSIAVDLVLSGGGDAPEWQRLREMGDELAVSRQVVAEGGTSGTAEGPPTPTMTDLLDQHFVFLESVSGKSVLSLALVLLVVVFAVGWRVDVNEFSMHRLYRNRLVRCYLGASVNPRERESRRQPFTGFSDDDLRLSDIGPAGRGPSEIAYAAPLHLVNTALNLVRGRRLAWQERKAAPFILSPAYAGFEIDKPQRFGYRRTRGYADYPTRLTLGSAMAISGAAASPNMGFRTSPALSFLLTVFNVRLGWWLGNPSHAVDWKRSGPLIAPWHLIREVFGLTHAESKYVYLSDGGHFENLGIYELVRRRCRLIIASDAGADPGLGFDDLGNAIRKCRSDLGIEIDLRPECIRREGEVRFSSWHCAVGTIHYDRLHPELGKGTILYLKSSLTGDEPADLLNYSAENSEFPHQTTADQWFDESQFESYRQLGNHVAHMSLDSAVEEAETEGRRFHSETLAQRLRQRWYPPSTGSLDAFARYGSVLDNLYDRLRNDSDLQFLDEQFYPEWRSLLEGVQVSSTPLWLPDDPRMLRAGFYFCNELIQLMEHVYLDLGLESSYEHPDNRGWINLFKHWSWSGMFQATWAISASTFGKRFQNFCEQRLGRKVWDEIGVESVSVDDSADRSQFASTLAENYRLNFLERELVARFNEANPGQIRTIAAFYVEVRSGFGENRQDRRRSMEFGFGLALIDGSDELMCFRIQDHLRKMGLGRRALRRLLEDEVIRDVRAIVSTGDSGPVASPDREDKPVRVPKEFREEFSQAELYRFLALFRSVCSELGIEQKGEPV